MTDNTCQTNIFFEEMDMLLHGLSNWKFITKHLMENESATMHDLLELVDEESKVFVPYWLTQLQINLVVVGYLNLPSGLRTYELTLFAKDMIEHINSFRFCDTSHTTEELDNE